MTRPSYDHDFWERLWSTTLREHADKVASRPLSAQLVVALADLRPGLTLDAGCGHGAETLWLAAHGWRVTAVDFSMSALAHARSTAEGIGPDVAERIAWEEGDLASGALPLRRFDLVVCLYVHVSGSVQEMMRHLASGVAPGGTLFMVGHRLIDPSTGAATAAAGQTQVSVDDALAALDPREWEWLLAEDRPRATAGSGVDAVLRARRLS